jgi:tetratricopeptide (TPR) repeat protein
VPDDRRIQCYAARTAYVLGKSELLERLNLDPAAHVNVAIRQRRWANTCSLIERRNAKIDTYLREIQVHDRLVKRCQSSNGMPKSVDYFRRAFEEFHKAIVRDELSFEALTGYADTYWEWWVNWQSSMVRDEMTAVAEKRAERYAHRAMALAADRPDPTALPLAQFTLGKVLLAMGQPREAITRISSALEDFKAAVDNVAHRPSFDDMRLSLLQVYRCASDTYVRAGLQGSLQSLNGKISDLVNEIQKDDRMRAFQSVGTRLGALDAIGKRPICSRESIIESF